MTAASEAARNGGGGAVLHAMFVGLPMVALVGAVCIGVWFRTGVELIHKDFLKALERVGVRPFSALGERFDPQRHEAVGRVERRPGVPDQTVVDETLRGYLFHDRVLRPAQVVVAVEPAEPPVDPVDPSPADDPF